MASRVNMRFVVILCAVIAVVFGGMAGAAYFIVKKSAADHYEAGQAALAAGDVVEAEKSFSRAVNKEPTSATYLEAWIGTLQELTPESETAYVHVFYAEYMQALRRLAVLQRTDVEAWERYLNLLYRIRATVARGASSWQHLASETDAALRNFEAQPQEGEGPPAWHRLRRFRALADLNMLLATGSRDEDFRDRALADFEAVLRVDPSDATSAVGRVRWLSWEASQLEESRPSEADELYARARRELDEFLADHPTRPEAVLASVRLAVQRASRDVRRLATRQERREAQRAIADRFAPRVAEAADVLLTESDPSLLTPGVLDALRRLERFTGSGEGELTARVFDRARSAAEDDPGRLAQLDFFQATFARDAGEHERAIELFNRVVPAPQVPMSLDGILLSLLRTRSALLRTHSAVDAASAAEGEARVRARERVGEYRAALDGMLPEDEPALDFLDARIAFLDGEVSEAQRLAIAYQRRLSTPDPEVTELLVGVFLERDQPGLAKEQLEQLVEERPNDARGWWLLSRIHEILGEETDALTAAEQAVAIAPERELFQQRLSYLRASQGMATMEDPIDQTLVTVQRLLTPRGGAQPRYERAIALLEESLRTSGEDARLYNALAYTLASFGRTDRAREVVARGLASFPGDEGLLDVSRRIAASGSIEERVRQIMESEAPEVDRWLAARAAYLAEGMRAQADDAFARARQADPDHPQVVELSFLEALRAERFDEAGRLAARAAEQNLDQVNGRSFEARLRAAQGRLDEALDLIGSVVDDGLANPAILRYQGGLFERAGQTDEAAEAYERALGIQPNDAAGALQTVAALARMGRSQRALEIARRSTRVASTNDDFLHLWLTLEAQVGDATAAMLRREDLRDREPDNRRNNVALADVAMRLGEWDKARGLIDELARGEDSLDVARLDARWHADQGDVQRGVSILEGYLERASSEGRADQGDVLTLVGFLREYGLGGRAMAALRDYRELQDASLSLDRRLAGMLLEAGRGGEAVEVIDRLIASDAEGVGTLRLARVEALLREGLLDEAAAALEALPGDLAGGVDAGLLRADLATRRGDLAAARAALDRTIASHPSSARAYVRRAQVIWQDVRGDTELSDVAREQYGRDAVGDLDEAIRLEPTLAEAHRLKAQIALDQGRLDDAVESFGQAVRLDPSLSGVRNALIRELVDRDRAAAAMSVIERAIEERPGDVEMRVGFAELMASLGRANEAGELFASAYNQRRSPRVAVPYVRFLLGQGTPAARSRAAEVLGDPNLNVSGSWELRLQSARLALDAGNRQRAIAEARTSFEAARGDRQEVIAWFNALRSLIDDHEVRMQVVLQLPVRQTPQRVGELMAARLMLDGEATADRGLEELGLLADASDAWLAARSGSMLGGVLYERGRAAEAARAWEAALEHAPEDGQLLNNLAYVLATELDQCERAAELARRAVDAGGVDATVTRSTLAAALIRCDRLEEAGPVVEELERLADGTPAEVVALVRRGELALAAGRSERARELASRARERLEAWGERAGTYREAVAALEASAG